MSRRSIDFLRPEATPRIGWALLAFGAAGLAVALWCERDWASRREVAEIAEQRDHAARRALETPGLPAELSLSQRRWQQAQPELRRPWLSTFRAIESATVSPTFLLSMKFEPSKGLVRLEAEAPSFDRALAYVQGLQASGALLPALLTSHESVLFGVPEQAAVKFGATTHWVMP